MNSSLPAAHTGTWLARTPMALALSAVVLLSGCAIHPKPFSAAERARMAATERTEMFRQQAPLRML